MPSICLLTVAHSFALVQSRISNRRCRCLILESTQQVEQDSHTTESAAIWIKAQAISCWNVRCVFLASRAFLFLSCAGVYNRVMYFPIFSHGTCQRWNGRAGYLFYQLLLRICVVFNGSTLDFEGSSIRSSTMEEKMNDMFLQIAKLPLLMHSISTFENCVQTLSQIVASNDATITIIEQIVGSFAGRVAVLETNCNNSLQWLRLDKLLEFIWT